MKAIYYILVLIILILFSITGAAQDTLQKNWDNEFFIGNKVTWGTDTWRYSGELQSRFNNNYQRLERWYLEGVATYMPSENWEIVPDLRLSVRPEFIEYRPGFGVIYKSLFGKEDKPTHQIVQQVKYQADINHKRTNHGVRYIIFYNEVINSKLIASGLGGIFYTWKPDYSGLEYIRAGAGLAYILNEQHTLNLTYFFGAKDIGHKRIYTGSIAVQLNINIRKDYKYVPAKYINY